MNTHSQTCIRCNTQKPISDFNRKTISKNGYDSRCRSCVNKRRNEQNRKNPHHIEQSRKSRRVRQEYINNRKIGGCEMCGYNKCLAALVFHHRDPKTKIDTIANMACRCAAIQEIKEEIDKCVLLCQNCHHELHEENGSMGINFRK